MITSFFNLFEITEDSEKIDMNQNVPVIGNSSIYSAIVEKAFQTLRPSSNEKYEDYIYNDPSKGLNYLTISTSGENGKDGANGLPGRDGAEYDSSKYILQSTV